MCAVFGAKHFLDRRVLLAHSKHLGFGSLALVLGEVFEGFDRVGGFKMGLSIARFQSKVVEVGHQAVDVLLSRVGGGCVDEDQWGQVV